MDRRTYLRTVAGIAGTTAVAGCLQGDAVLHKKGITATSPTKEWEVELEAGNQMRLEVDKSGDSVSTVTGYVHHAASGDEIVAVSADGQETFEVPKTATYGVSIEVGGAKGEIRLRDMN